MSVDAESLRSHGAGRAEQQRDDAGAAMRMSTERGLRMAWQPYGVAQEERVGVGTTGHVGSSSPDIVRAEQLVQKALRAEAHVAAMAW